MVAGSFSDEFTVSIAPARFWKAGIVDSHIVIPKIAPQYIESVELEGDGGAGTITPQYIESVELEGDGGAGTIKTIKFGEVVKEMKSVKNKVEVLDESNFLYKYSVLGSVGKFESTSFEIKLEASADGGTFVKINGEYTTAGDYVPTEEESKAGEKGLVRMLKAVEAFLLAKPDAYA